MQNGYKLHPLDILLLNLLYKSTVYVSLTFIKFEKATHENFDFVNLSFFLR